MWYWTLAPPALSPKRVTRFESPPKWSMFSCTHRMACCWSFNPRFPGHARSSVLRKPNGPSLQNLFIFLLGILRNYWKLLQIIIRYAIPKMRTINCRIYSYITLHKNYLKTKAVELKVDLSLSLSIRVNTVKKLKELNLNQLLELNNISFYF